MNVANGRLSKPEWTEMERDVAPEQKTVLRFLQRAFHQPDLVVNATPTLAVFLKLEDASRDDLLYLFLSSGIVPPKMNRADAIRLQNAELPKHLYELLLMGACADFKKAKKNRHLPYWRIHMLLKLNVTRPNQKVRQIASDLLKATPMDPNTFVVAFNELEHHPCPDLALYPHQRALFQVEPGLVTLVAPTGMGKTLSPIGLSERKRIVFLCGARHVCLALAQNCVAANVCVAFAFGCNSPADVRLHNSSVSTFDRTDKRTGAMRNVDHLDGRKVRVTISDLGSILHLFAWWRAQPDYDPKDLILYWDEPTYTLDCRAHPLHAEIQQMWRENPIPFIVLSSATLPDADQLQPMFANYQARFGLPVHHISAAPGPATVPILDPENYVVMPHQFCSGPAKAKECSDFLLSHTAILRYVDLVSAVHALQLCPELWKDRFATLDDVNAVAIKRLYAELLPDLPPVEYRRQMHKSTIHFMGEDAHTIRGPAIYLAQDVDRIAQFCVRLIPSDLIASLQANLKANDELREKAAVLRKLFDDLNQAPKECDKKVAAMRINPASAAILAQLEAIKYHPIELPARYVPNSAEHCAAYKAPTNGFTSGVDPETAQKILDTDVVPEWKILLLAGVGIFSSNAPAAYTEIVKGLASRKMLFVIIAAGTDYIYGTNYPFYHAYIAKDLINMSQQKLIQALGRVGRFNDNTNPFTVLLRDASYGAKLFLPEDVHIEAEMMNALFVA